MVDHIGLVIKGYGTCYDVLIDNRQINCNLRGRLRKEESIAMFTDPVSVGDSVSIEINNDGSGVINKILTRRNVFSRKGKGKNRKPDIIAANIDLIVIIQSFKKPKLNLRFVDRIIVRGESENIDILLCINKSDLADINQIKYVREYYSRSQIDLITACALTGEGLEELKEKLYDKVSVLIGYSGVGKTAILNKLFHGLNLRVNEVSGKTGKGKHTTTNVQMLHVDNNISIIDTPGLREFGIMDIEPHLLERYFSEFQSYSDKCEYQPCSHDHEPNCEVKKMVDNSRIHKDRYISYLNILYSLKDDIKRMYD